MNDKLAVIILAAGLGKRMGSTLPKVAISTREMPLIQHVLHAVDLLSPDRTIIVTGHQREVVEDAVNVFASKKDSRYLFSFQEKQIGTGDAVKTALPKLGDFTGNVLILYGDVPLISTKSLKSFVEIHNIKNATLSLLSFTVEGENAYGRVIRSKDSGEVSKIVEAKDCSKEELQVREYNSGIYLVDSAFLHPAVNELRNENAQKEYYLTDIVERAVKEGQTVNAVMLSEAEEVLGVNTLVELNKINRALIMRKIKELMEAGVSFDLPETCVIDSSVEIAAGVKVGPNTQILGNTKIGKGSLIEGNAYIKDTSIGENVTIKFSVKIEGAVLSNNTSVGPFAHIRPDTRLEEGSRIGNFVETKKAHIGKGAKANHLTYLGDVSVGADSNIGAGTITCNYDGYIKSKTEIGENVFIGSNTALVAPVKIESGSVIGAGSVITKTVAKDSLAFTRAPQVSKAGWAKSRRDKAK